MTVRPSVMKAATVKRTKRPVFPYAIRPILVTLRTLPRPKRNTTVARLRLAGDLLELGGAASAVIGFGAPTQQIAKDDGGVELALLNGAEDADEGIAPLRGPRPGNYKSLIGSDLPAVLWLDENRPRVHVLYSSRLSTIHEMDNSATRSKEGVRARDAVC